jgi:serine/threonine protein kinase
VAIKLLGKDMASQPLLVRRFEREFLTARSLDHPHVVRGLDFGTNDGIPYLVMEYVEGESLGDRIERCKRLSEAEAVRIICQVGSALEVAHAQKLIHRDVKPDNILLTTDDQAKLTDLGLAKNVEADHNLTRTRTVLGTPNFMAPEQFQDAKRVDARCDVYSLGATLYMAVTGELPFRTRSHRNLLTILKKKLEDELTSPRQLVPRLSQHVDLAIRRAMRARLDQRFASCRDFLDALSGTDDNAKQSATAPDRAGGLAGQEQPRPATERRHAKRYATDLKSSCQVLVRLKDRHWEGMAVDISESGVCLVLTRRFEPGTNLSVELHSRKDDSVHNLQLRVVRVNRQPPKHWALGCVLHRMLSNVELEQLL